MTPPAPFPLIFGLAVGLSLCTAPAGAADAPIVQTEDDEYTRYELLDPATAAFRITYEVTATAAGATTFFNPVRKGSTATDEAVFDRLTGRPLPFDVVPGSVARAGGLPDADLETSYIRIRLARPVPAKGETRILILKTYVDPKSYVREGDAIVFSRSLGIRRNAIVLPPGYEVVSLNVPSQVLTEPDGRIFVSFMNAGPTEMPVALKARKSFPPLPAPSQKAAARLGERARQDREIAYFLNPPETHSFFLHHDYTETRPEADKYLNVVRKGSTASNPSARILDTGEELEVATLRGEAVTRAGLDLTEDLEGPVQPDTEVVVVRFSPVTAGGSVRLRISETYTDPDRYRLDGDELVFDRSLGRPRNAIVLPAGFYPTACSIPATVSETDDGRIRLDFVNSRPDNIDVLLKGRRRDQPPSVR
jgi:hypothetical protein